jgi:hypothetical protein
MGDRIDCETLPAAGRSRFGRAKARLAVATILDLQIGSE